MSINLLAVFSSDSHRKGQSDVAAVGDEEAPLRVDAVMVNISQGLPGCLCASMVAHLGRN